MGRKRKSSGEDEFDIDHELAAMVSGVGSVSPLTETPPKRRKKVRRRPIGYQADIDALEEVDE